MESDSTGNRISPEQIAKMQDFLLAHPIDHAYDAQCAELNDSLEPDFLLQCAARSAYHVLKSIDQLPDGIE